MNDVTCLIKTFARPRCLERLLRSLYQYYPGARSVVVDDSPRPYAAALCGGPFAACPIRVYELPHDRGISAGRNYGLARIETPYFVLLDDDFVLRPDTPLERMREVLIAGPWDILGGSYVQYDARGQPYVFCWEGELVRVGTVLIGRALQSTSNVTPCNIVNNFFLARTEAVQRLGGWDPRLKVLEHNDFFLRASAAGLRIAHLRGALVDHCPVSHAGYHRFRADRQEQFRRLWMSKHRVSHFVSFQSVVYTLDGIHPGARRPVDDYLTLPADLPGPTAGGVGREACRNVSLSTSATTV